MDKKKKIIEKARELISKKGYYEATMKEIAKKAGVAQGTPYLYFKNKEEIFIEIILMLLHDIDDILAESIEREGDFWAKIEYLICQIGLCFKENKEIGNIIQGVINDPKGIGKKGQNKIRMMIDLRIEKFNNIFKMLDKDKTGINNYTDKEIVRFTGIAIDGVLKRVIDGIEKDPRNAAEFVVKCLKSTFGVNQ